jgi:hypothetical protein
VKRTVLLATDDGRNSGYGDMRDPALAWAHGQDARVILYDRSSESYFVDPYSSGPWTADVESAGGREGLLEPDELELLGRHYLALQVIGARRAGVDAYAYLSSKPGPRGMADVVQRLGVDVVVLPTMVAHASLIDRVRGNTLERFREILSVEIMLGDARGISPAAP